MYIMDDIKSNSGCYVSKKHEYISRKERKVKYSAKKRKERVALALRPLRNSLSGLCVKQSAFLLKKSDTVGLLSHV